MRLFSCCIPIDDGAAPNPFWGVCTLNICKPVIRRVANVDDWVIGVGSKNVKGNDYSGKLIYAMKITNIMPMEAYYKHCKNNLPNKIPDITNNDYKRQVGDCIYDFQTNPKGILLPSVHNENNRDRDLGGLHTLLSEHFYYFGDEAICIPPHLRGIIKQGQGHKSSANDHLKEEFVFWLESKGFELNKLHGNPQIKINFETKDDCETCASVRCRSAIADEKLGC